MEELVYPALLRPRLATSWTKPAVADEAGQQTFGEGAERAWRLVEGLRRVDPSSDETRFAVISENRSEYFDLWQAAGWGGGIICPLNTRLSYAESAYVLRDCDPHVVFVDRAHADLVSRIRGEGWAGRLVVGLENGVDGADVELADFVEGSAGSLPPREPRPEDPVILMYTGGTSGRPKAVLHTQQGLCLALHRTHSLTRVAEPDTRFYQTSPMFHIMATAAALAAPAGGAFVVLRRSFDIAQMIGDIAAYELTHVAMVPTMFSMLLEHPTFDPESLASLRYVIYGGAPVPSTVLGRLLDALPRVEFVQSYGMTEACGGLTGLSGEDHRRGRALDSVGRSILGVELQIQDENGRVLPADSVGEVCARCGSIMAGYRGDPERTSRALRDGWYHTGDLGSIDDDGYLRITDRVDDMIITGGENVYSSEVEAVLAQHPEVVQSAVVGAPDSMWGQRVHAFVVFRGAPVEESDLKAFLRSRIAGYKVPKTFTFRTDLLPLSGTGKVQKHQLRSSLES
jgi:acyl-CoA synthetase (AMP-forming)/AMP-acid ligase II